MNVHQILYKKQMLLAKKNRWKTVTRRPIKPQPKTIPHVLEPEKSVLTYDAGKATKRCYGVNNFVDEFCPYGKPGDQLYTKENYEILDCSDFEQAVRVKYKADGHIRWVQLHDADWEKYHLWKEPFGSKPSIFMFKTLSRFWDEVTEITVERIQDITAEEIWNEGIRLPSGSELTKEDGPIKEEGLGWPWDMEWLTNKCNSFNAPEEHPLTYRCLFRLVWQSMYKGGTFDWNNNPWVWVIRYKPLVVNGQTANVKSETAKV